MSVKILTDDIKKKSPRGLYYIYGAEEYLKRHYYASLKKLGASEPLEFNLAELDGAKLDITDFNNVVNSYPVMGERRFVGVLDLEPSLLKKNFAGQLESVLKTLPDYCTVVFFDSARKEAGGTAQLIKLVSSAGGVAAEVKRPSEQALADWCTRHFASEGKSISRADVHYLIEIAEPDMLSLGGEIEKLCGYCKNDTVTRADIDALVTRSIGANRYELSDAFVKRDYGAVMRLLEELYLQNIDDIMIANVFYWAFSDLLHARLALDSGRTQKDLIADFKMRPFAASKAMRNAAGMSRGFLHRAASLCLELDRDLKSTSFSGRELITKFVARLVCERQNG